MKNYRAQLRRELSRLPGQLRDLAIMTWQLARRHPRVVAGIFVVAAVFCFGVWRFAAITANSAIVEERMFWMKARTLSLDDRTAIRNYMVRTGRVPHLLPWWEMDSDRCAATVWKLVNLLTGVELTHGDNGAAWMLRKQNSRKLHTLWDGTSRFNADGGLGNNLRPTIAEFRAMLERLEPDGVYVMGFRWTHTAMAGKIRRDKSDLNSHIVVMTKSVMVHMFRYGELANPIVADFQERFFDSEEMQPVWLAEVVNGSGKPFKFTPTRRELRLDQNVYPWKELKRVLRIPDNWVPGSNAMERCLLYWFRDGYDMYPRLP